MLHLADRMTCHASVRDTQVQGYRALAVMVKHIDGAVNRVCIPQFACLLLSSIQQFPECNSVWTEMLHFLTEVPAKHPPADRLDKLFNAVSLTDLIKGTSNLIPRTAQMVLMLELLNALRQINPAPRILADHEASICALITGWMKKYNKSADILSQGALFLSPTAQSITSPVQSTSKKAKKASKKTARASIAATEQEDEQVDVQMDQHEEVPLTKKQAKKARKKAKKAAEQTGS
jgi:hypothetical protein